MNSSIGDTPESNRGIEVPYWFELLATFVARDIRARYKRSILGFYWAVLSPLLMSLILTLVFSVILNFRPGNTPFAIFVLSGLLTWQLFANGLGNATNSVSGYAQLITKVRFRRWVLPVSSVLARVVDLFFTLIVLVPLIVWFQIDLGTAVLWLPPLIGCMVLLTIGVGLVVAGLNVYYRDIEQLVPIVLNLWFYLSPVIYPAERFPERLRFLFWMNPPGVIVQYTRAALLENQGPSWTSFAALLLVSSAIALVGAFLFHRLQRRFAEIV
ncbi:MAG: ABC transporter [Dehalococcoidia bacterium]|nr:ABC transporter [Dehalococcoidia bacterium]